MPESLGSVGIGGGWQLAWQKDGDDGALKRVFLKGETGGDVSNFNSTLSLPGGGGFQTDHETFPVYIHNLLFSNLSKIQCSRRIYLKFLTEINWNAWVKLHYHISSRISIKPHQIIQGLLYVFRLPSWWRNQLST